MPGWPALDVLCEVYQTRPDRLGFGRPAGGRGGGRGGGAAAPADAARPAPGLLTVAAALLHRSACARFGAGEHGGALADWWVAFRLARQAGNDGLAALALQAQDWMLVFRNS